MFGQFYFFCHFLAGKIVSFLFRSVSKFKVDQKMFLENRFLENRFWKTRFRKTVFWKLVFGNPFLESRFFETRFWKPVFGNPFLENHFFFFCCALQRKRHIFWHFFGRAAARPGRGYSYLVKILIFFLAGPDGLTYLRICFCSHFVFELYFYIFPLCFLFSSL